MRARSSGYDDAEVFRRWTNRHHGLRGYLAHFEAAPVLRPLQIGNTHAACPQLRLFPQAAFDVRFAESSGF